MTKIIATSASGKQQVFKSYKECADTLHLTDRQTKDSVRMDIYVLDKATGERWILDELVESKK